MSKIELSVINGLWKSGEAMLTSSDENPYSVIFTAKLREGAQRPDALKALHSTFKLQKPQIQKLIQQAPAPIKQKLDKQQADKIVKALWNAGWHSELQQQGRRVFTTDKTNKGKSGQPIAAKPKLRAVSSVSSPPLKRLSGNRSPCTICVPKTWEEMDTLNPNACLQAGSNKNECYLIVIEQKKEALGGKTMPLEHYAAAVAETAAKGVNSGEVLQAPELKQNNKTLLRYTVAEMKGLVASTEVHYLLSVYETEAAFYTAYFWCSEDTYAKKQKLFRFLAASFLLND